MRLEAGAIRRVIAFPMASADPQAKSDRPASAMRVIATRGIRSRRAHRWDYRFDGHRARGPSAASATKRNLATTRC